MHPGQVANPSQSTHTPFTHAPVNLPSMLLDCGRKLQYPEETYTDTGRTCTLLYTHKPRTTLLEGTESSQHHFPALKIPIKVAVLIKIELVIFVPIIHTFGFEFGLLNFYCLSVSLPHRSRRKYLPSWPTTHMKLNLSKTELLFIPHRASILQELSVTVDTTETASHSARNLGVVQLQRASHSNITLHYITLHYSHLADALIQSDVH